MKTHSDVTCHAKASWNALHEIAEASQKRPVARRTKCEFHWSKKSLPNARNQIYLAKEKEKKRKKKKHSPDTDAGCCHCTEELERIRYDS